MAAVPGLEDFAALAERVHQGDPAAEDELARLFSQKVFITALSLEKRWRHQLRTFLEETLEYQVYDPAEDQKKKLNDEEAVNFRFWKTTDFERYRQTVRKIIDFDLDLIEQRAD